MIAVIALSLALIQTSAWAKEDAADAYAKYVDNVIPLTFAQVDAEAAVREGAVFAESLSRVQRPLIVVSDAGADIAAISHRFLPKIEEDDVKSIATNLVYASELVTAADVIREQVSAYQDEREALKRSCDDSAAFSSYDISHLDYRFMRPDIETLDNTYINSDPISGAVNAVISIWQVISNTEERSRIDDQTNRLNERRAQNGDYRKSAQQSCRRYVKEASPALAAFDATAAADLALAQTVDEKRLNSFIQTMLKRLDAYEAKYRDALITEAMRIARAQGSEAGARARLLKESIESNLGINRILLSLESTSCGDAGQSITEVQNLMATARAKALRGSTNQDFIKRITDELADREKRCGGLYR